VKNFDDMLSHLDRLTEYWRDRRTEGQTAFNSIVCGARLCLQNA